MALCRELPGWAGTKETFTNSHLSWSTTILYQLPPSTTIHSILRDRCMCFTVFFTTSPQVLFGPPFHTPYISSSKHWFLFTTNAHTIATCFAVVARLCHLFLVSLSLLFTWNSIFYLNVTHPSDHSHLWPLKCHLIFFPYRPGITSKQHTTSHTTAVQSPSLNQWYIPIGKQW